MLRAARKASRRRPAISTIHYSDDGFRASVQNGASRRRLVPLRRRRSFIYELIFMIDVARYLWPFSMGARKPVIVLAPDDV